jgi:endonuclease G
MKKIIFFVVFLLSFNLVNGRLNRMVAKHSPFGIPQYKYEVRDYYIFREGYIVNYDFVLNKPHFVLYNLNKSSYGGVPRYSGSFMMDTNLNKLHLPKISHSDYTNSGYERGHLVRSEERTTTPELNKSTFILSNIVPQTKDVNSGVWLRLENFCKDLCQDKDKNLYIVAGGIYSSNKHINNKVPIPDTLFKIIVIMDNAKKPLSQVSLNTEIIAVKIPNITGVKKNDWRRYTCTVKDIENSLGYDFFPLIDDKIEGYIESKVFK